MKTIFTIALTFITVFALKGQDFRNISWGMTMEEVVANEDLTGESIRVDSIIYRTELNGMPTALIYYFSDNSLTHAMYMIQQPHQDPNDYIKDFAKVKERLTEKYGEPVEDYLSWKNERYKERPEMWGTALRNGNLWYWCNWKDGDNLVEMTLYGTGQKFHFHINYVSAELKQQMEEAEKAERLKKL